jgi:general secretion pathway protein N
VTARFEDVSGVLDVSGTIELRPDRTYSLAGRISATPAAPQDLVQQLRFLGSADADGMRSFRFEGQL